ATAIRSNASPISARWCWCRRTDGCTTPLRGGPPAASTPEQRFIIPPQSDRTLLRTGGCVMDRRFHWGMFALLVLTAVAVGMLSFNAGVSHGLALSPGISVGGAAGGAVAPYYWHRGWGWGFGFGPVFVLLFWFMMFA